MSIFQYNDVVNSKVIYVVPDQATLDSATAQALPGTFIIGTETDAQNNLAACQAAYLTQNAAQFQIAHVIPNADGTMTWTDDAFANCTDNATFMVLDPATGTYTQAAGKTDALAKQKTVQQNFLTFIGMGSYQTLTALPTPPKKPKSANTTSNTANTVV